MTSNYPALRIVEPAFDSRLTDVIIELDHLRRKRLGGTTHPRVFFDLKETFHLLESIGSARIEGNRTTIAEAIEAKINPDDGNSDRFNEIHNIEETMLLIDTNIVFGGGISNGFLQELHKHVVKDLQREGDRTPGYYRKENVTINGSTHLPPDWLQVETLVEELLKFINERTTPKYDLLRIAIAHHRFAWVHPFTNGNGRVARLLTYAMLVERGFNVSKGRLLNPTAIFCADREAYYRMLGAADSGTDLALVAWCEYVLEGLLSEISKLDRLLDYEYLAEKILLPAIGYSTQNGALNELESKILLLIIKKQEIQSSDLEAVLPKKHPSERSRILAALKRRNLIQPVSEGARRYVISFSSNPLLRGVIYFLGKEGFLNMTD